MSEEDRGKFTEASSIISSRLSSDLVVGLQHLNARDKWLMLLRDYQYLSPAQIDKLQEDLRELRYREDDVFDDTIAKVNNIVYDLQAAGVNMSENTKIVEILLRHSVLPAAGYPVILRSVCNI